MMLCARDGGMDDVRHNQIELQVHGLTMADHGRVIARVFAAKLSALVGSLEAADRLANGSVVHTYTIALMHTSQPTVLLDERMIDDDAPQAVSAIPEFVRGVEAIKTNTAKPVLGRFIKSVSRLTHGAEKGFAFAEVRTGNNDIVRIDEFLRRRARSLRETQPSQWFNGASHGSFDGKLAYVDVRGALPQIKLILTAGGIEIDCICRQEDIEALGDALSQRVRVYGRAIYDGSSQIPVRVEVTSITSVKANTDFSKWRGAFRPFVVAGWDAEGW